MAGRADPPLTTEPRGTHPSRRDWITATLCRCFRLPEAIEDDAKSTGSSSRQRQRYPGQAARVSTEPTAPAERDTSLIGGGTAHQM